jgi:hypothetical protein
MVLGLAFFSFNCVSNYSDSCPLLAFHAFKFECFLLACDGGGDHGVSSFPSELPHVFTFVFERLVLGL